MIQVETVADGFTLIVGGKRALFHSVKTSCIEVGTADFAIKQNRGAFKLRRRSFKRESIRNFRILETGLDCVSIDFDGIIRMHAREENGKLVLSFSHFDKGINVLRFRMPAKPQEHIYGCGGQYTRLDRKGTRLALWVAERGLGRRSDRINRKVSRRENKAGKRYDTSFPHPSFVSSANYYVFVDTDAYAVFDFRSKNRTTLECWQVPRRIVMSWKPSAVATLGSLSEVAGRQKCLPEWIYNGAWLDAQGGTDAIIRTCQMALDAGVKVSALWVQDWCGKKASSARQSLWDWKVDEYNYPDITRTIRELSSAGIRFLGYINPFLALDGELYHEARERSYCVKNSDGGDYIMSVTNFPAALLDLTNPETTAWFKSIIQERMLGIGMSGWMADFGEYAPVDAVYASGENGALVHNQYPALWARVNREAVDEAGMRDSAVFFLRSGWAGSSRSASLFWAGDQLVNFSMSDGLASVIPSGISLGFSGVGIWHSDIGGCLKGGYARRSAETFMRWAEYAAFTPVMRTHEGFRPELNHQFNSDQKTLAHFARCTEMHAALAPYHRFTQSEYAESGIPPIRHPYLHHENDSELHRLNWQYLYGRDLMVAPVIRPRQNLHEVYLPDDSWVHLWSSRVFRGGWTTVEAPLGYPPVFYRESSDFANLFDALRRNVKKY